MRERFTLLQADLVIKGDELHGRVTAGIPDQRRSASPSSAVKLDSPQAAAVFRCDHGDALGRAPVSPPMLANVVACGSSRALVRRTRLACFIRRPEKDTPRPSPPVGLDLADLASECTSLTGLSSTLAAHLQGEWAGLGKRPLRTAAAPESTRAPLENPQVSVWCDRRRCPPRSVPYGHLRRPSLVRSPSPY